MAKIQILSNTNYQLENILKSELVDSSKVQIAVAFLKKTGLDLVKKPLELALENDSDIEFIVGLDFKTTDYNALMELENIKVKYKNFNYYCFGDKENNYTSLIFHPKIYLFNNEKKFNSIIGLSNFTKGGLTTNFEVNTFFQETIKDYKYFLQLETIYKEIKFQDSIFKPNKDYLKRYSLTRKEIDKYQYKALKSEEIKEEIKNLEKEAKELEGTIPSLKKIIINFIKQRKNIETKLKDIYIYCKKYIKDNNLEYKYQSKDFEATVRGELNKHKLDSNHPDNMKLFERVKQGVYKLSEIGLNYEKR